MRKLVKARNILEVRPIEGADAIEAVRVDDWWLVSKKNEFKVDDFCIYFEIDSFLPKGNPAFDFLMARGTRTYEGVEGHKLKTIKLRGQVSQGLALPLKELPVLEDLITLNVKPTVDALKAFHTLSDDQIAEYFSIWEAIHVNGADVSEFDLSNLLGVVKWEPKISAQLAGFAQGTFPSFIKKTDQERCQNLGRTIFGYTNTRQLIDVSNLPYDVLHSMIANGRVTEEDGAYYRIHQAPSSPDDVYEITIKLDGSSLTAFARTVEDGAVELGVCSRNLQLKTGPENAENAFVKMFNENIKDALQAYVTQYNHSIAVQGELMGPGIQGNREGFTENKFFVFDIYDIDQSIYLPPFIRMEVFKRLVSLGMKAEHVPVVDACCHLSDYNLSCVEYLLNFAEGKSINHPVREGLVFKRGDGQFSFKAISNKFLLNEKD